MLHTLNILDDIKMPFVTKFDDVDYRAGRIQAFRSNIFFLVTFEQLIETKKQEDEQ